MTKEKLQCLLPVVFTVGPDVGGWGVDPKSSVHAASAHEDEDEDDGLTHGVVPTHQAGHDALVKFATLLAGKGEGARKTDRTYLEEIIRSVVEGETRVLISNMTMEEIFTEREMFKRRIARSIQAELAQFGLKV